VRGCEDGVRDVDGFLSEQRTARWGWTMGLKALDLFCGQGGATKGLQLAGYHVTGVDIEPQPRYCGDVFYQDDAMVWLRGERESLWNFDLIWASPPCQHYSELVPLDWRERHPDLLGRSLDLLRAQCIPYIVENVAGARWYFSNPVILCGSMFGLPIQRHRWFELGNTDAFFLLPPCNHSEPPVLVSGRGMRKINGVRRSEDTVETKRAAMGVPWMSIRGVEEAIPPAYSKFLAQQLLSAT
jgi:DNA (cytosine-5)-methyltransferase 1